MNRKDISISLISSGFNMLAFAAILRLIMVNSPDWISTIVDKVSCSSLDFLAYSGRVLPCTFELISSPVFFVMSISVFVLGLLLFPKTILDFNTAQA